VPGGRTGKKGERTVVEKKGEMRKMEFSESKKGRDFFWPCMNCFSRDKGRAAILLICREGGAGNV